MAPTLVESDGSPPDPIAGDASGDAVAVRAPECGALSEVPKLGIPTLVADTLARLLSSESCESRDGICTAESTEPCPMLPDDESLPYMLASLP